MSLLCREAAGYAEVAHWNITPVIDIYGTVQGADLGSVSRAIEDVIAKNSKGLVRGSVWWS